MSAPSVRLTSIESPARANAAGEPSTASVFTAPACRDGSAKTLVPTRSDPPCSHVHLGLEPRSPGSRNRCEHAQAAAQHVGVKHMGDYAAIQPEACSTSLACTFKPQT